MWRKGEGKLTTFFSPCIQYRATGPMRLQELGLNCPTTTVDGGGIFVDCNSILLSSAKLVADALGMATATRSTGDFLSPRLRGFDSHGTKL